MSSSTSNSLLHGPIAPALLRFTFPLTLAMILQALYGAIDMVIVGHLGTTADVSAVGTGSLITQGVAQLVIGLTTGGTVCLGQAIGAQDNRRAAETFGALLRLSLYLTVLLTALAIPLARPLTRLMSTPSESFNLTVSYITICCSGIIFIVGFNAIAAICRGLGDSRSPLLFVGISTIVNIFGDLILVGPCQLGTAGAALATVLSQAVCVTFSICYLKRKGLPFPSSWQTVFRGPRALRSILGVGIPIAAQDMLNYVSFAILASIMNSMGLLASAAMAIEGKVFSFFILVPVSFMSSLSAFVAQNVGAGQERRATQAVFKGMAMAFSVGLISFVLAFWFGGDLASIFEKNQDAIHSAARLIKGAAFEHLLFSAVFCLLGYFNGKGLTLFVMLQGAICAFFVRLPLAWWISQSGKTDLIWMGLPLSLSALMGLLLCSAYFLWVQGFKHHAPAPKKSHQV